MTELIFREAISADVLNIISLVWHDKLRQQDKTKPDPDLDAYLETFNKITLDENQFILVVENQHQELVGTCHLTLISYLPFFDKRLLVEYVRVSSAHRAMGIGRKMFDWIDNKAIEWGAKLIQLTTDKRRPDAIHFYEKIGFVPSHIGMKKRIT